MKANTLDPMHKKRCFPLKSSLVNVSKTAEQPQICCRLLRVLPRKLYYLAELEMKMFRKKGISEAPIRKCS